MKAKSSAWLAAAPLVFVFIWSTGFISAKLGMPYSPALSFLALRCFLSVLCFVVWLGLTTGLKNIAWPQDRMQWMHLLVTGVLVPPPAVAHADEQVAEDEHGVVDAIRHLGVTDVFMPASPQNVWRAIQTAQNGGAA